MSVLGKALVAISCIALLHAAFSTYEHLSTLKALSGDRAASASLPTSIIVEALVALVLFLPGTALASASLEDVTYRGEMAKRSIDDSDARMGFMRLSSRGRALFGDDSLAAK
ncbi:magnesium transporter [Papiliotrema laurentii]|uniref:Magnesium transporter n=1 Tax=Papiliotrema laurentii TaxID=5418 RepID=A0AAD9FSA0_PAPLA|nr:magnesium transporter [Papiliotrema laurentii]